MLCPWPLPLALGPIDSVLPRLKFLSMQQLGLVLPFPPWACPQDALPVASAQLERSKWQL